MPLEEILKDKRMKSEAARKVWEAPLGEITDLVGAPGRRFYLYTYPSGGGEVRAIYSCTDNKQAPLIYFCRGGAGVFGLPHPYDPEFFAHFGDAAYVITSLRGGINDGVDEYGGADVEDIKALIEHFPHKRPAVLMGASRGGMEILLALERYPEITEELVGAVCISGILDMEALIHFRPDLRQMFSRHYGMAEEKQWCQTRTPKCPSLPLLVVLCEEDLQVEPTLPEEFEKESVEVWRVEGAGHCLEGRGDEIQRMVSWCRQYGR